jgi:hypothetical protein
MGLLARGSCRRNQAEGSVSTRLRDVFRAKEVDFLKLIHPSPHPRSAFSRLRVEPSRDGLEPSLNARGQWLSARLIDDSDAVYNDFVFEKSLQSAEQLGETVSPTPDIVLRATKREPSPQHLSPCLCPPAAILRFDKYESFRQQ